MTPSNRNILDIDHSDEEVKDIKQFLAPHWHALSLETTKKEIGVLIDRLKLYEGLVKSHYALVPPARRLPTDILSLIFLCYLDQCRWRSPYLGAQYPTILLTHVCRRWRQVALLTPLLWSAIRVRFLKHPNPTLPNPGQAVNPNKVWHQLAWSLKMLREEKLLLTFLERSDCAPLQLTVAATEDQASGFSALPDHPTWEEMRQRVVATICNASHPHRWKRVNFTLTITSSTSPLIDLLTVPSDGLPQLQSVEIICRRPSRMWEDFKVELAILRMKMFEAHNLRTVKWGILLESVAYFTIPVQWENLTELHISDGETLYVPGVTGLRLTADYGGPSESPYNPENTTTRPATMDDIQLASLTPVYDAQGKVIDPCYCPKLKRFGCNVHGKEFSEKAVMDFDETMPVVDTLREAGVNMVAVVSEFTPEELSAI
ncbi:hypothetical protein FA13DRAFT_1786072 [Coprinellus micaceus]|uniref:Uncharacterized protein n=1 Tax=Coprinellus micaceus TaxID=71717 RepID=A0A4Y7TVQ8_COPMI|nr:hypothetical protein FA13DRAFT_1786072 [Coprinellus micaceus]